MVCINWNTAPAFVLAHVAAANRADMSGQRSLSSGFQWPWQYEFPPFFTIQPNSDTRAKQLDAWCDLVLGYHRSSKSHVLDVNEALSSPLFYNENINRILDAIGSTPR